MPFLLTGEKGTVILKYVPCSKSLIAHCQIFMLILCGAGKMYIKQDWCTKNVICAGRSLLHGATKGFRWDILGICGTSLQERPCAEKTVSEILIFPLDLLEIKKETFIKWHLPMNYESFCFSIRESTCQGTFFKVLSARKKPTFLKVFCYLERKWGRRWKQRNESLI